MSKNLNNVTNEIKKILKEIKLDFDPIIEIPRNDSNGHFATNVAMVAAKSLGKNPREIATIIADKLIATKKFEAIEVAGPGFINIKLKHKEIALILEEALAKKDQYGAGEPKNFTYNLEIVSANPTGYLHVGHARNGTIGDAVARILKFNGYKVQTEYYTNDAGNQINILAITVFVHYLRELGISAELPEDSYSGEAYEIVAKEFVAQYGDQFKNIEYKDKEICDEKVMKIFKEKSTEFFMKIIKKQLVDFGVEIEHFSSEKAMYDEKRIEKLLENYKNMDATYEKDGAVWLKTTAFQDDKDRVLVKSTGDYTYITPDLATHEERLRRSKADKLINFWGGDHHGYIVRMRAGLSLLGAPENCLDIDMIQMVRLVKDGKEYKMSKRKGTAIWLIDLLELVGKNSLRYMLASKTPSSHMDFDLDIVTKKNSSNPVYYAQYATARSNKVIQQAKEQNILEVTKDFDLLTEEKEVQLLLTLDRFAKNVDYAAKERLPHIICDYIQTLTKQFHSYYSEFKIIDIEHPKLSSQRVALTKGVYQTLSNALKLIAVDIIDEM
ncbi:arginyl-tRNA synthetase [Spiroplasma sabaudiense Ar-1343]|uniref:Arginine--tRNA ligase n=1 Tax=Spiroplasma sabaudiense Ar-1343 TaxID=1276257 RepID=W6A9D5_9MOLU|nr:arginine--tRNA ligase [Spiroplasma sabaudiense]AHI53637.1 arginyl-tRNA synthetase [Spiroplasma sabaudiense Ar-1343]